jgi:hypothetical protein
MNLHPLDPLHPFKPLLDEIENRPNLKKYLPEVLTWLRYIQGVKDRKMRIMMVKDDLVPVLLEFEYPHRWRDTYRLMVLAKLYKLEDALKDKDQPYTLMSLTTYQDGDYSKKKMGGYSIDESFQVLSERGRDLMRLVKMRIAPGMEYLWTVEPHKFNDSGYPHRHYILNRIFNEEEMNRVRRLWTGLYCAGSPEYGIDFSVRVTEGNLRSLRNYVMAYLAKSISPLQLSPGEVVYHAIASHHHYRFFGASRGFSALMQREVGVSPLKWLETQVIDEWGDTYTAHRFDPVAAEVHDVLRDEYSVG